MDVIERLTKQGKDLGYEGEALQTCQGATNRITRLAKSHARS